MVKKIENLYKCEICGLIYKNKRVLTPEQALDTEPQLPHSKLWGIPINKSWVEECEKWCRKHKSCNIEMTKHIVKP